MSRLVNTPFGLSLAPAFFAAGCCATTPLMVIFGLGFVEVNLWEYRWGFRLGAVLILVVSLWWYFTKEGIRTLKDYQAHCKGIVLVSLQTTVYAVLIYALFVYVALPEIMQMMGQTDCCGI